MINKDVEKYLSRYAFSHWKLEGNIFEEITSAIVVPAISEYENIRKLLQSLLHNNQNEFKSVLVIFCINNLKSSSQDVKEDNFKSLHFLRSIINKNSSDSLADKIISSGMKLALVDAASDELEMPEDIGGVGLARKIGMDLALTIFDYSNPAKKILICLDAD